MSSLRSRARCNECSVVIRSSNSTRIDSPNVSMFEPPRRLAWYMAASALDRRVGASTNPNVLTETPTDASRNTSVPSISSRLGQHGAGPFDECRRVGVGLTGRVLEQGEEFVATEPGDELTLPGRPVAGARPPR